MSTVIKRSIRSTPFRDAGGTWKLIVGLLTAGKSSEAETEMMSVSGIVASTIADQCTSAAPIICTCEGPRTRFYCLYDDEALEGAASNESGLPHDATKGDWRISIPCSTDDLAWVRAALKEKTSRISARDKSDDAPVDKSQNAEAAGGLVLDLKGLFE